MAKAAQSLQNLVARLRRPDPYVKKLKRDVAKTARKQAISRAKSRVYAWFTGRWVGIAIGSLLVIATTGCLYWGVIWPKNAEIELLKAEKAGLQEMVRMYATRGATFTYSDSDDGKVQKFLSAVQQALRADKVKK